jgi:hypothetical protein
MKLRFHQNSLRFRLNQLEVGRLAAGYRLTEEVWLPGSDQPLQYSLGVHEGETAVEFHLASGGLTVLLRHAEVKVWAKAAELEFHRSLPTLRQPLKLMIEKDLECLDGPAEERDPHAFPRDEKSAC